MENCNHKDNRIGCLLLGTIYAIEKDNKKLKVTHWQLTTKCEFYMRGNPVVIIRGYIEARIQIKLRLGPIPAPLKEHAYEL